MRDILLFLIVSALGVLTLVRPRVGLFGYTWFGLMRPDVLAFSYGSNRYSLILALTTLVGSLGQIPRMMRRIKELPLLKYMLILNLFVFATLPFAVDFSLAYEPFEQYFRMLLMAILIPLVLEEERELRIMVFVIALSIGALSVKYGIFGIRAGGIRYSTGHGGMLSDNNDLALAFTMAAMLLWGCMSLVDKKWMRIGLMAAFGLSIFAVVGSFSRTGAVAMVTGFFMLFLRSKKKLLVGLAVVAMTIPATYLVWDKYKERLSTITAPTTESSAASRLQLLEAAAVMFPDRPITGFGFGKTNQGAVITEYGNIPRGWKGKVMHNTWAQVALDMGIFGLIWWLGQIVVMMVYLNRSIKRTRKLIPEYSAYPIMFQTTLVPFYVGSTFLSRYEFDMYHIIVMTVCLWQSVEKRLIAQALEKQRQKPERTFAENRERDAAVHVDALLHPAVRGGLPWTGSSPVKTPQVVSKA